ncbi:hypothetical protein ACIBIZ_51195 [Nonomuraea spiralis]|uniref:hypothetical protein n=1 Tax=Nonomuraea spiralis TaxID=46182 RepID=UPI0037BA3D0A
MPILTLLLAGLIVPAGSVPQYFVDPRTLPPGWKEAVAIFAFAVVFSATATLAFLGYLLVLQRAARSAQIIGRFKVASDELMTMVASYAGVGAILGTLLGLRLAAPLQVALPLNPTPPPTFMEYISLLGNMITIVTLVMISSCWGLVIHIIVQAWKDDGASHPSRTIQIRWLATSPAVRLIALVLLVWVGVGIPAGSAASTMMLQPPAASPTPTPRPPAPASSTPTPTPDVSSTPTRR